jgi:hypothetical protein
MEIIRSNLHTRMPVAQNKHRSDGRGKATLLRRSTCFSEAQEREGLKECQEDSVNDNGRIEEGKDTQLPASTARWPIGADVKV